MKAGIVAVERGRVAMAEAAEHASDLLAEARAEYEIEQKSAPAPDRAAKEVVRLRGPARETAGP